MERIKNIIYTLITDFIALVASWFLFYVIKFEFKWFESTTNVEPIYLFIPSVVMSLFWITIFGIYGLYRDLYLISRFDEILKVAKITLIGTLILFFLLFIDQLNWNEDNISNAKFYAVSYWLVVFITTSIGRFIIRTFQKYQAIQGKNLHKAVIIGSVEKAEYLYDNIKRNRVSGMEIIGYLSVDDEKDLPNLKNLGKIDALRNIVYRDNVNDIIVALEPEHSRKLVQIIDQIDLPGISVKILPDFYQMIVGLNRTNQIFGLPLIDVLPDPMPAWEKFFKRLFDIIISTIVLIVTIPLFIIIALIIKMTSKGPAIFKQERVGLFGKPFLIYKFRTMFNDAEAKSGPVWAKDDDPRVTPFGRWLRKMRLDELPQLGNVLRGDMSLVGPRPERSFFVDQFKKQIPLYSRRLRVRPGITGWAQVKWKYDESMEDVIEKTKYDLFYVENMSLKMDFKILFNTLFTVATGKGQ